MASETKFGPVRVLHLEDNEIDHLLVQSMMESDGLFCEFVTVQTNADFTSALAAGKFDLIISDYTLPSFNGLAGLSIARQIAPKTPFIFFSGTIGEETAVESLKKGASDYILKSRPRRLVPAVLQALQIAREQALLEESQNRNREQAALLDKARDGIMVCDLSNHHITYWNQGAERIYGWSSAEVAGQDARQVLFQGKQPAQLQECIQNVMESGEWMGELDEMTKDGRPIVVQARATLICDESGRPKSLLLINTDITESRQLQEKFLRAQRMESLGVLVSGIAHDLNNALAPILVGIEIMRKDVADEDGIFAMMEKSARRGTEMVKQILAFARGADTQKISMDVGQLMKEMSKIIEGTFSRGIGCQVTVGEDLWPVSVVATQIYQVLMNLCVNAKDAMPGGGNLKLAAQNIRVDPEMAAQHAHAKPGNYLCVSVRDTGSGIPPEQLKKIFEPFFSTKPVGKGTGLGLSTSLEIIRNHGGFMTVNSEVGKGTEFKFYLPAVVKPRPGAVPPNEPLVTADQGECVLVVDHESSVLALTRAALENFGYRVVGVSSTWEANAFLAEKQNTAQLIVIDASMPFMETLAAALAKRTGRDRIKVVARGFIPSGLPLQLKPDAVVPKPFTIEQLLLTVQEVLAQKAL